MQWLTEKQRDIETEGQKDREIDNETDRRRESLIHIERERERCKFYPLFCFQIEEPYLAIEEATTYELSACYNVSIECHSGDMVANILTSTLFDGKIYAKGSPETCMEDINGQLKFSITFGYNDLDCGVTRETPGSYTNDVIIQHHDRIVTSSDLGLSVTCQYDLTNKTVSNKVDLQITGEIAPSLYEESVVDSPNVIMRVADDQGQVKKHFIFNWVTYFTIVRGHS